MSAVGELFGPRLSLRTGGGEAVLVLWDGEIDCSLWLYGSLESVAWQLLDTAQDVWLERLGEEGRHPGAWATASPQVHREGANLVLSLRAPGSGTVLAAVHVPLGLLPQTHLS